MNRITTAILYYILFDSMPFTAHIDQNQKNQAEDQSIEKKKSVL